MGRRRFKFRGLIRKVGRSRGGLLLRGRIGSGRGMRCRCWRGRMYVLSTFALPSLPHLIAFSSHFDSMLVLASASASKFLIYLHPVMKTAMTNHSSTLPASLPQRLNLAQLFRLFLRLARLRTRSFALYWPRSTLCLLMGQSFYHKTSRQQGEWKLRNRPQLFLLLAGWYRNLGKLIGSPSAAG